MKTRKHNNNDEIEKTLNSFNGMDRAEAPPFFYTRLQARMENRTGNKNSFLLALTRPAVSFATLGLLLVLNVSVLIHYINTSKNTTGQQPSNSGIQQFAEVYGLDGSSVFTDKTNGQ